MKLRFSCSLFVSLQHSALLLPRNCLGFKGPCVSPLQPMTSHNPYFEGLTEEYGLGELELYRQCANLVKQS